MVTELEQSKVSIIIPCFNAEPTLPETLNSCIKQTHENLEILVINDHSTDRSADVAEEFARKDLRIKHFLNPNKGAQTARNYGLEKATGDFVKFLDSDDFISLETISEQTGLLLEHPSGISHCQWAHFISTPGDSPIYEQNTYTDFDKADEFLSKLWSNGMYPPHAWLIPRKLLQHCKWDEALTQNQDGEFFARVISSAKGVYFAKGTAYYRLPATGNTSQKKGPEHIQSHIKTLESYAKVCESLGNPNQLVEALQQQIYNVAYRAATTACERNYLETILCSHMWKSGKISFPSKFMRLLPYAVGIPNSLRMRGLITRLQNFLGL